MADDWEALKKQVRDANDIIDVVGAHVALRAAGRSYRGLCPFHDDHNPSFNVDPERQRYRCWSCGKTGDVFSFVQEHERVDFREALELLARRAGISLEKKLGFRPEGGRAGMLDAVRWAAEGFHACLLESPLAEAARNYLRERRLNDDTVRTFQLGFAPGGWDWLVRRATASGRQLTELERVGLVAARQGATGYYDRFRDRLMFPIRNGAGQTIGFGGRLLPGSPEEARSPKYYNSPESPLFAKSEVLYGMDRARQAASVGYLAVVEGYTDVLMAHQCGVPHVISTMGTALGTRHVRQLRRWLPHGRVVLVFDADQGGDQGVDRALEVFVSEEVDLAIATLPDGMDPCDLLVARGSEPFQQALASATDALDFKLDRALAGEDSSGIEGRRRAAESVLRVIAAAPQLPGQALALKRDLVISRIAARLRLPEQALRDRLKELKSGQRPLTRTDREASKFEAPAPAHEGDLLQVLLAEPGLVPDAAAQVRPEEIGHPGLRRLLQGLYDLQAEGKAPDLDGLRERVDHPALVEKAFQLQEKGRQMTDRVTALADLAAEFDRRRGLSVRQDLQNRLHGARDHTEAVDLLRRLQQPTAGSGPGHLTPDGPGPERGGC